MFGPGYVHGNFIVQPPHRNHRGFGRPRQGLVHMVLARAQSHELKRRVGHVGVHFEVVDKRPHEVF
jgi:hypothetical protein